MRSEPSIHDLLVGLSLVALGLCLIGIGLALVGMGPS
jgi:hypothetical protein